MTIPTTVDHLKTLLSSINSADVEARIRTLKEQVSAAKAELTKLRKLLKFIAPSAATPRKLVADETAQRRVPRGLYERMLGLLERSSGEALSAKDLANQLNASANDIHLCVQRHPKSFFHDTEGRYGLLRNGN